MQFDVLTLFPDLIHNYASESILGRAQENKLIRVAAHNWREYSVDQQHHVDDRPYGGGPGMILQVEPIYRCLEALGVLRLSTKENGHSEQRKENSEIQHSKSDHDTRYKILLMDPAGKKFDQRMAEELTRLDRVVLIAGRYEGFDARVNDLVDERVSIGDYVLAGGELPALTIIEAVARLLPEVLGNHESLRVETFSNHKRYKLQATSNNYAEYPQYTRPENFKGMKVPVVLLSGDHQKIEEWRKKHLKITR